MEKDHKKCDSKPCAFKSSACKIISATTNFIDKIIEKVDRPDPANNTKQRVISSIFLLPFAVYAIFFSLKLFVVFVIAMAILMTIEWIDMAKNSADEKRWRVIGFFYILIPLYAVYQLRLISVDIVFWMFSIIWVTDIFAFFSGRILGGKKLAPTISPNKTWSGLAGAVIATAVIGLISASMFPGSVLFFVIASVSLSIIEQISDLVESKFKRIFGVKDSGNIIPGHGGVLDRLDGMMFTAPAVLLLITVFADRFGL